MPRASGLDGLALVRREVGQPCRLPVELGAHHVVAARADRTDQRRELVGAAPHHEPMDLLGDELVGPHDVARGRRVVRGEPLAERDDVDHPHGSRYAVSGSTSRGTARSSRTRGWPTRSPIASATTSRCTTMPAAPVALTTGRPARARRGARRGRRAAAFVRSASARACSRERFRIRTGPTPRWRRCFTASAAIWPAPTTTTSRPPRPPSASSARSAPSATNASGAAPSDVSWRTRRPGARRRVEEAGERGTGGALALGPPQRLAHLCVDLRLAEDHRVEASGDGEQVVGGVLLPVGVQGLGQFLGRDAPGLGEQPLQRQEPGVVARHARRRPRRGCRSTGSRPRRCRPGRGRDGTPSRGRRR